jgi:hemoglobin/transferrin/lactoferrin receptor protein
MSYFIANKSQKDLTRFYDCEIESQLQMKISLRRPVFFTVLCLFSLDSWLPARAEDTDPADIEVVVSATRTERKAADTPGSVSVINRSEMDRQNVEQLTDIVRYEPDVSLPFAAGGTGPVSRSRSGAQSFNIRGIDGNRVLFTIDGVRQPDQFNFGGSTTVGRDYLDVNAYKRVEILKGSASGLYGSDAIGGVVTFVTLDPSDLLGIVSDRPFAFKLRPSYDGADDSFSQTTAAAYRIGQLEMLALYTRRDGHEVEAKDSNIVNPADYGSDNGLAKFVYHWNPENTTKLTGEYFDRQTDTNLVSARRTTVAGPTTTFINNVPVSDNVERFRISLEHSYRATPETVPSPEPKDAKSSPAAPMVNDDNWLAQADAKIYYQNAFTHEASLEERVSRNPTRPDFNILQFRTASYEQDILGGELLLQSRFTLGPAKNRLTYGLEASASDIVRDRDGLQVNLTTGDTTNFLNPDTFPVKDLPDTTVFRLGGFLQDEISFGANARFTLIPGVRVDYYNAAADTDPIYLRTSGGQLPIDYTQTSVTPKIAALFKLTPELTLTGQYNRGFRNPTPEDLNGTVTNILFGYQTVPNPDLKSETSDSFEVTVRGDYRFIKFSAAGYYNRYHDFIETFADAGIDPITGLIQFQSQNLNRAEIYGVEGKMEIPLGAYASCLNGFSVRNSIGYTVGTDLDNGIGLNSVDPLKVISSLRYDAPNNKWGVELIGTYADTKQRVNFLTSPDQFVPGSYYSLDLIAYANLSKNVTANIGVYNLTDQQYFVWQDVIGLPTTRTDLGRFAQPGMYVKAGFTIRF